eukprot:2080547-Alexandrium_andersonii.AAC.1
MRVWRCARRDSGAPKRQRAPALPLWLKRRCCEKAARITLVHFQSASVSVSVSASAPAPASAS